MQRDSEEINDSSVHNYFHIKHTNQEKKLGMTFNYEEPHGYWTYPKEATNRTLLTFIGEKDFQIKEYEWRGIVTSSIVDFQQM